MRTTAQAPWSNVPSSTGQRCVVHCTGIGEPQRQWATFRLTVTNRSDKAVSRWALSFTLPASAHAYGDGAEFDIIPESSTTNSRPDLFEIEHLGSAYICAATWNLAPGTHADILVTVHGPTCHAQSYEPQDLSILC
ncbi:hypothetical protein ACFYPT_37750 [Streptomyces sp. NPDC005529]|uniref:hypothetical protein n=1 Tax=unclassified Streptomyces TaxID=2593676 RepID=UPI0033B0C9AB